MKMWGLAVTVLVCVSGHRSEPEPDAEHSFLRQRNGEKHEHHKKKHEKHEHHKVHKPWEEAVKAMGTKSHNDLQPDYVYDDDFVRDGDSPYEALEKERRQAAEKAHELDVLKEEKQHEVDELENAARHEENVESVAAQKEAQLNDAKHLVNKTGIADEEAVVEQEQNNLADAVAAENTAKNEVGVQESVLKEEQDVLTRLEEESQDLRKEHGAKHQKNEQMKEAHGEVIELEDHLEIVEEEL